MISSIIDYLSDDWTRVQDSMREALSSDIELLNSTNDSLLSNSGKMLRPMLLLLMARACGLGFASDDSIRYAAAAELLHNSTLLHDDVVDESDERRGQPTVSSILGGTASVLVGDYWLVKAVGLILDADRHSERVVKLFAKTLSDLSEGELLQLQKAGQGDTTQADALRIIYCKTASLFEAVCTSAVISVGGDDSYIEAAREYGTSLGIAFQIKDDILDYDGANIGKPIGADLKEHKITLPLLGALSEVDGDTDRAVRRKVLAVSDHPEYMTQITEFVHTHHGIEYAERMLNQYIKKSIEALSSLPPSRERDYLETLAWYTADRDR